MEVLIPQGKELRYRCAVAGCRWPEKALSMCTMVEHLAYHYAKIRGTSKDHFYYRCKKCGDQFYFLGMTSTCRCRKTGRQSECVAITRSGHRKLFSAMLNSSTLWSSTLFLYS
ncbi:hypothetical protein KIN20_005571 [Parelaphostrongylus tenuis]|uniref:Uncharacterized protein n=1 Tax=Parelaphostrongylus tenuis TaxID=148309 RepID=A0AAD5MIX5_PARTN|nr:hypothetical protein KIN20_005571 [Parelaphostrongylus tenuis]